MATTDSGTLPSQSTWYLAAGLGRPGGRRTAHRPQPPADPTGAVRVHGLRHWLEQSHKQIRGELGRTGFQVRSDTAIRRHHALATCAFSFYWDAWFAQPLERGPAVAPAGPPAAAPEGRSEVVGNATRCGAVRAVRAVGSRRRCGGVVGAVEGGPRFMAAGRAAR